MTGLTLAGTIAGALIAIATVLHWAVTRAIRVGTWLAAAVRLPAEVDRLAGSVTQLSTAVQQLAVAFHPAAQPEPVEVSR